MLSSLPALPPLVVDPLPAGPSENIQVCFRVRPFDRRERAANEQPGWRIDTQENVMTRRTHTVKSAKHPPQMTFPCSTLLDENTTTEQLYERQVNDIVRSSMGGINGTVMAYGQTASGKTFTLKGGGPQQSPGVIALAMEQVFSHIDECEDRSFLLRVSYVEVYNEKVRCLLDQTSSATDLTIHESKQRGAYVNCREEIVRCKEDVLRLMNEGEERRHYGQTEMNDLSSRSHTILRLVIESSPATTKLGGGGGSNLASPVKRTPSKGGKRSKPKVKVSCLNFVDLAGSERLAQTQAAIGSSIQKEGSYINKSLMYLGICISRLSEGESGTGLPFRESKLTRLLASSIGGNSRTTIIVTVSPAASNVEHTVSSLRFGARAITIKNCAHVNEIAADQAFISHHQAAEQQMQLEAIEDEEMDQQRKEQRRWQDEQAMADQLRMKAELEEKLANLQQLILKSTTSMDAAVAADEQARRRHTFGSRPFKATESAAGGSKGNSRASLVAGSVASTAFQLAHYQSRVGQLEALLGELSQENQSLLDRETAQAQAEEDLTTEYERAAARVELFRSGSGLKELALEELEQVEAQMEATLKKVRKEISWREWQAEYPERVAAAEAATKAKDEAEAAEAEKKLNESAAAVVDPAVLALQQQLADMQSTLNQSNAENAAKVAELAAQHAEERAESERHRAAFEAAAAEREEARQTIRTLQSESAAQARELVQAREQTYKFSKQLLAAAAAGAGSARETPVASPTPSPKHSLTPVEASAGSTSPTDENAGAAATPVTAAPILPPSSSAVGVSLLADRTNTATSAHKPATSLGDLLQLKTIAGPTKPTINAGLDTSLLSEMIKKK